MSDPHHSTEGDALSKMESDRRQFLKSMGVMTVGGILADLGLFHQMADAAVRGTRTGRRPNIVVLLVDELRFPTVFPDGITTPEQFLRKFMPNAYELWRHGVKFTNHHTAGMACSPSRASIVTGLYPHQQWELITRTPQGPQLRQEFPTYGKLLRGLGYNTPYAGKWHLSNASKHDSPAGYLARYGFDALSNSDPLGQNGDGATKDPGIADLAVSWLQSQSAAQQPYCLTVGFVNPHDRQFFWAGSEGDTFEQLFAGSSLVPFNPNYTSVSGEDDPPPLGYPAVPPNWESGRELAESKPMTQTWAREFTHTIWGGASDDPGTTEFALEATQFPGGVGKGVAPYSYWQRGLDMYTYVMTAVDEQIGRVVASVPKDQLHNTVILLLSDHGEYNGAHGFLSGKVGTAYREAWHVPLIVADPSGRFVAHTDVPRHQLTSSVDFLPLLVSLGNGGSRSWMRGELRRIYGQRLDLVPLLRSPGAKGRDHVLFATDEIVPRTMNYMHVPLHLLGVQTRDAKLCTYTHWAPGTTVPVPEGMELEFYDYSTAGGLAEMQSTPDDPRATALARKLFKQYVPQEMQRPLPTHALRTATRRARAAYVAFQALANAQSARQLVGEQRLATIFDYGDNF